MRGGRQRKKKKKKRSRKREETKREKREEVSKGGRQRKKKREETRHTGFLKKACSCLLQIQWKQQWMHEAMEQRRVGAEEALEAEANGSISIENTYLNRYMQKISL